MLAFILLTLIASGLTADDLTNNLEYIATRLDDYWFEYHATHKLLLVVGDTCHVVMVDDVMAGQMRDKSQREKLQSDLYEHYIKPNVHESVYTLKELRDQFHDLYANVACVGKYVYKVNYVQTGASSPGAQTGASSPGTTSMASTSASR